MDFISCRKAEIEKFYIEIRGLSKLTLAKDTFFLYDVSNMLRNTFIIGLDKYIMICGSISYSEKAKEHLAVSSSFLLKRCL